MAKQTGKKKTHPKGSAQNPLRLDYGQQLIEANDDTHYVGFVVEYQHRKNGAWIQDEVCNTRKDAIETMEACLSEARESQEYVWRRRHGLVEGKSVRRIIFDETTTPEKIEKMLAEVRADFKKIVDAKAGVKIKPFKPNKYPRYRVVERTAIVRIADEVIAEKGLQDEQPDSTAK